MNKGQILFVVSCFLGGSLFFMGCSTSPPPEPTPLPSKTTLSPTEHPQPSETLMNTPIPEEIEITFIDNAGFLLSLPCLWHQIGENPN